MKLKPNSSRALNLVCISAVLASGAFTAQAADLAPSSFNLAVGSANGKVKSLAAANENAVVNLYTNNAGKLQADFVFTGVGSGASLQAVLKQKTAKDVFTFQVRNAAGAYVNVGSASGTRDAQSLRFALPNGAFANGQARARIVSSASANDANLDLLVISDAVVSGPTVPPPTPTPTPTSTPTPTPTPTPVPTAGVKLPPTGKINWDWQIGATSDSAIAVPAGVTLLDVDVFTTSAAKVAQLKASGLYMICYVNAGSYQPGYPDSAQYPNYLKVQADPNWPGEYFLDVTDVFKPNSVLASILDARLKLCKEKGFDAVEPDNLQNDENVKGGRITTQQQIDFNGWFADAAHRNGLAVFQKNGPDKVLLKDRTGKMMVEKFDGILNEECQQYNECAPLAEYPKRGKLALNVEYTKDPNCAQSNSLNINTIRKDLGLKGGNMSGYKRLFCQ
ncbi:MAG: hypothetical protein EOP11_12550 [Proteobacteria bacterium]|nr:MAG: hypothetical protein EOP11_12550 [Pseudomonadota bacterium]